MGRKRTVPEEDFSNERGAQALKMTNVVFGHSFGAADIESDFSKVLADKIRVAKSNTRKPWL
jgi:hypothetical protein